MNLFTTYTKEEIKFLKEITKKESKELLKIKLFTGLQRDKDFVYFREKIVNKKEIISNFDFIYVKEGKLGVIEGNKVVKILSRGDCFGLLNVFSNKKFLLVSLEKSVIIFFNIKTKDAMENLLDCIVENISGKILI